MELAVNLGNVTVSLVGVDRSATKVGISAVQRLFMRSHITNELRLPNMLPVRDMIHE